MVKVHTLGRARVYWESEVVEFKTRKAFALLVFLVMQEGEQQRDYLATLFWPDQDQANARKSLRQALFLVRHSLPENTLLSSTNTIDIARNLVWVDAKDYYANLRNVVDGELQYGDLEHLQQALSLYQGEFLEGFSLSDCPEFDDWQYIQIETFRQMYTSVLYRLTFWYTKQNNVEMAMDYARRFLKADKYHEEIHQLQMKLLYWAGQPEAALRQYEYCQEALKELSHEPCLETKELLKKIKFRTLESPEYQKGLFTDHKAALQQESNSLPKQTTSFLGRQSELQQLIKLLAKPEVGVLTITGPGGIGKTRLALRLGEEFFHLNYGYKELFFLPITAHSSSEDLAKGIADVLELSLYSSSLIQEQVLRQIGERSLILILDNGEYLLNCTDFLLKLLNRVPKLKLVVASREKLNLQEEWIFELLGLGYPNQPVPLQEAQAFDALQLFYQRAKQLRQSFSFEQNFESIQTICRITEGMPLAIELAASWINILDGKEIVLQIQESLQLFDATIRNFPKRHQSLNLVIEGSLQRLSDKDRKLFEVLAVFKGGFSLNAAIKVASADLYGLACLLDKSLLRLTNNGRYEIHELLRQFAFNKLAGNTVQLVAAQKKYVDYYSDLLSTCESELKDSRAKGALATLNVEWNNVVSAWYLAITLGDISRLNKMVTVLAEFCEIQGLNTMGLEMFEKSYSLYQKVLKASEESSLKVAYFKITTRLAGFWDRLGDHHKSQELRNECEKYKDLVKHDDPLEYGLFLVSEGGVAYFQGEPNTADEIFAQCLEIANHLKNYWYFGLLYIMMAETLEFQGKYPESQILFRKSINAYEQIGNLREKAFALNNLGRAYYNMGYYDEAKANILAALKIREDFKDTLGILLSRLDLGRVEMLQGKYEFAEEYISKSLLLAQSIQAPHEAWCLTALGKLKLLQGDLMSAKAYFEKSIEHLRAMGNQPDLVPNLNGLALISSFEKNWQKAKVLLAESLSLSKECRNLRYQAETLISMGHRYSQQSNDQNEAKKYYREALKIINEMKAAPLAIEVLLLWVPIVDHSKKVEILSFILNDARSSFASRKNAEEQLYKLNYEDNIPSINLIRSSSLDLWDFISELG